MHLTIRLMDNHWHTAYTQVNLRQAMNTREGQSHISCVPSRPNQLHPQVQPPLTFVIRRCIDADHLHQCLPTSHVIRMNTKKIYPSLLRRALSVCITAFIVLIWPQPAHPLTSFVHHIVRVNPFIVSSQPHCSCQSLHRLAQPK
jgi:hypothetical protein